MRRREESGLRILIVEDEYRIGCLLEQLIHWEEFGASLFGMAQDGQAALALMGEELPDLVITDIKMPAMDGLELIRRVRELEGGAKVRFVIISGFKEFDYAHTALRFGVTDYLLKPIQEEEVNGVIRRLCDSFFEEKENERRQGNLRKTAEKGRFLLQREILSQLEREDRESLNAAYDLKFADTVYRAIAVKLDFRDYNDRNPAQERLVSENLLRIMERHLCMTVQEQIAAERPGRFLCAVFNYCVKEEERIGQMLQEMMTDLKNYSYAFSCYELTMGLGTREAFSQIPRSLGTATLGAVSRILLGTGRIIYPEQLRAGLEPEEEERFLDGLEADWSAQLGALAAEGAGDALERLVDDSFLPLRSRTEMGADTLLSAAGRFVCASCVALGWEKESAREQELLEKLGHCHSFRMLVRFLKEEVGALFEAESLRRREEGLKPIRDAREYIKEHFGEKITLEDTARRVGLNPVYFSELFKKKTGKNFSVYVTEVRMERAKELLRTTGQTMDAVAESVGYHDTRHFSKTFERAVGVKPSTYRRLYS